MTTKTLLLVLFFLIYFNNKSFSQFTIEVNGSDDDTIQQLDPVLPIEFKVNSIEGFKIKQLNVTHARNIVNPNQGRALRVVLFKSAEMEKVYTLNFSRIIREDAILFEIEYYKESGTELLSFETWKFIKDTKLSATKPYKLQIHLYDNDVEVNSPTKYIVIAKKWSLKELTPILYEYLVIDTLGLEIGENEYYFNEMPKKISFKLLYNEINSGVFFLETDYLKYGGIVNVGVLRNIKKLKKQYEDQLNVHLEDNGINDAPFLSALNKYGYLKGSLVYIEYMGYPPNYNFSQGYYLPIVLPRKKK